MACISTIALVIPVIATCKSSMARGTLRVCASPVSKRCELERTFRITHPAQRFNVARVARQDQSGPRFLCDNDGTWQKRRTVTLTVDSSTI